MTTTAPQDDLPRLVRWLIHPRLQTIAVVLSALLIVCFIAVVYILRPYDGMQVELARDGLVVQVVHASGPAAAVGVQIGDRILLIDDRAVTWPNMQMYRRRHKAGDTVPFVVERGDEVLTMPLTLGSYLDNPAVLTMDLSVRLLAVSMWMMGMMLCLFTSPHDVGPRLIGLCFVTMAIGFVFVNPLWTSLAAHTVMVIAGPLSTALFLLGHLYFPTPALSSRGRTRIIYVVSALTLLVGAMVILENWTLRPSGESVAGALGFHLYSVVDTFLLMSFLPIIGLLVRNRIAAHDPQVRRQIGIVLWSTLLSGGPYMVVILANFLSESVPGILYSLASLSFVFLFVAYTYAIYQRRLLRLDLAINRTVVILVLALLVLGVSTLALSVVAQLLNFPITAAFAGGVMTTLVALAAPFLYRTVQRRVDLVLYGSHYDYASVTAAFSERFTRTLEGATLARTLLEDLPNQMGIRQVALFFAEGDALVLQQAHEAAPSSIPLDDELCQTVQKGGSPAHATLLWPTLSTETQTRWQSLTWGLLFVPLVFEERLRGLLILGSRASGDIYSAADVRIIGSVAHQGALAFENVRLVETLRGLNRQLVRDDEAQRKQVARDLHDVALQQLFFVKQGLFRHKDTLTSQIDLLDDTIGTLRRTIRGLRPPLLDQGLRLALQSLVEEMQKVAGGSPTIALQSNVETRLSLSDEQATALYRIAQEALSNALKHAQAEEVVVTLETEKGGVRLRIADDGAGVLEEREGHYGLAGMRGRAAMIGAHLDVASIPGQGTRVAVKVTA